MSGLLRSAKKASTKGKKKIETHELKAAYILPAKAGDEMIQTLGELPSKYFQGLVGPMMEIMRQSFRGDITVTIDPNNPGPSLPVPDPETEAAMEVKLPDDEE